VAIVLPRANLNEQVYATLRSRILAREHGPGEKLSLHELAAELGVSRSPVHHALTRLVSEGLLTVKARRGYFVSPITTRVLVEGYEVRLALELHAADVTVETAVIDFWAHRDLFGGAKPRGLLFGELSGVPWYDQVSGHEETGCADRYSPPTAGFAR